MRTTQVFDDVLEAGVSGEIIQHDGTKWARTTVAPGSTPPGGSPNEIQFNNGGSFDGASGIEFDDTDLQIAGSQGIYFRGEAIGILSSATGVINLVGDSQTNIFGDITYFADASGNGLFRLETQATPVNYLTVKNSATATELAIQATGTDSNIGIKFIPKGSAGVYIGDFATGIDYALWFLGETTSGTFKWMEDEDYFQFQDDIFMNSAERIYFRDTDLDVNIYSPSANTLTITAATINLTGTVALSVPLAQSNIEKSGTVIATIIERMPPATSQAQEFTIAGASTPAESLAVLAFDDATVEYMDYKCEMSPQYQGGGLTIKLVWAAAAASNEVRWGAALRRMEISSDDFDTTGHTYAFNEIDATASATVGHWMDDEITFTDGADMDSVAAGETFILRIYRNASHANDDNGDDAYLISVSIRET